MIDQRNVGIQVSLAVMSVPEQFAGVLDDKRVDPLKVKPVLHLFRHEFILCRVLQTVTERDELVDELGPNVTQYPKDFPRPKHDAVNSNIQFVAKYLRMPRIVERVRAVPSTQLFKFREAVSQPVGVHELEFRIVDDQRTPVTVVPKSDHRAVLGTTTSSFISGLSRK